MRILLLTHRLPYAPNRGDRIRAYHLLRVLAARHEVHLVSLIHDDEEASHVDDLRGVAASVVGVRLNRPARMFAAALSLATNRPLTHTLLHSPRMAAVLQSALRTSTPDVVVAYCTGMARYAVEPPLDGKPWILDMVDVDSEKWSALAKTGRWLARPIFRREASLLREFERRAMTKAVATTVVSEKERALLEHIAPESNSLVVSNGIDLASFSPPGPPSDALNVVFCGVFNYSPNEAGALWLASAVWPLVQRAEPRARLTLVGMHPTRAVRALAKDPTITVTGEVPDVRPYLWGAAIAVAPLQLARGLQNKVLEALAAGLPCVVTPAVLEGLPAGARAACDPAEDPRAFADAIVTRLRESPDARRAHAARADLGGLSWDKQLGPILELVDRAARQSRIRGSSDGPGT